MSDMDDFEYDILHPRGGRKKNAGFDLIRALRRVLAPQNAETPSARDLLGVAVTLFIAVSVIAIPVLCARSRSRHPPVNPIQCEQDPAARRIHMQIVDLQDELEVCRLAAAPNVELVTAQATFATVPMDIGAWVFHVVQSTVRLLFDQVRLAIGAVVRLTCLLLFAVIVVAPLEGVGLVNIPED
ncbi:hypothetical protein PLICRDRAFT_169695 [Plicaturopsis crispa FD-325 SS-3]|nr:hypothetical protein PLICRDRAFT_169695 [Plicaturopsis crispa FD-325 SS-3]